ncbi:MAG: hypothetical protein VX932_04700 [Candidatus Neomarinimicrobiota bacterium]|nr:hypothetical protein [Candidatus Neomarinimicrobiota bacterium]
MIIYFGWILKKKQLSVKSIKKEIEPNIAEEMAKKILEDAKMHRAVRKKENEK